MLSTCKGDAFLALAFCLFALHCIAQTCPDNSACGADTQRESDLTSLDETVMLQTQQVKSNRQAAAAAAHGPGEAVGGALSSAKDAVEGARHKVADVFQHHDKEKLDASKHFNVSNIVYVRIPKTASTTCCEVTRRIGDHNGLSGVFDKRSWPANNGEPGLWADHGPISTGEDVAGLYSESGASYNGEFIDEYKAVFRAWPDDAEKRIQTLSKNFDGLPSWSGIRNFKLPTFLWTTLREPKARAMSYYYWHAGEHDKPWDTPTKMTYLKSYGNNNQFRYIRPPGYWTLDAVMSKYDLIAITERIDESLVVLAATLKVPLGDVVYLATSSKSCFPKCHPELYEEPLEVQQYVNGTFPTLNHIDYDLYKRANDILDAKIVDMHLAPAIQDFKQLVADVAAECGVHDDLFCFDVVNHVSKNTYVDDQGCNHQCVKKFRAATLEKCEWCE